MPRNAVCSETTSGSWDDVMKPDCSPRSSVAECLAQRELTSHYVIVKELGSGTYGKVLLARCQDSGTEVALKMLAKKSSKLKDFLREFNISYYLSPHRAIVNTYDVAFETSTAYVFAQEYAPLGDLFERITPQVGLPEQQAKRVIRQVASAVEFTHSKGLVHRDIKPENILVFDEHFKKVKLMDFGMTKRTGTWVKKVSDGIPYTPPEVSEAQKGARYCVDGGADVWALGVLLYCMLTGNFPWELARYSDPFYREFLLWHRQRRSAVPSQWRRITPRGLRLFRKVLEPRLDLRSKPADIFHYLDDSCLLATTSSSQRNKHQQQQHLRDIEIDDVITGGRGGEEKDVARDGDEEEEGRAREDLSALLKQHGVETRVNKRARDTRIRDWVLST